MPGLVFNRVLQAALLVISLSVIAFLAIVFFQGSRIQHLTLAGGDASGESYILSNAIKAVVERYYPKIRITVQETGGTIENLQMLEDGRAQLAAAQADALPGPGARIIAVLYDDTFQLLVRQDSHVRSFANLRGARIALAPNGGQFQSFLRVAEHFGLHVDDFRFMGTSDASSSEMFAHGEAGAIFRVRALGNPSVQKLVEAGGVRFLPIEHAAAMKINYPAFIPAVIPEGAYLGNPAVPPENLPTAAMHRTLLARDTANADVIRAITGVLMERRQEIAKEIPEKMAEVRLLLAQARRPESEAGLGPPLHPGASSFYDKDKPSFLLAHADYVGLIITVALMAGSWIWELKRWMQAKQKLAADQYSNRVVSLMASAQIAESLIALDGIWRDLLAILEEAVRDLNADKLSEESFDSFRSILQIAMDVTKERRAILALGLARTTS